MSPTGAPGSAGAAPAGFDDVLAAIRLHGEDLRRIPGVIDVRPGYRFKDGWITAQPAVVVTVARKLDRTAVSAVDLIPRKLGTVVVDVAPATPVQQLRATQRHPLAVAAATQGLVPQLDMGIPQAEAPNAPLHPLLAAPPAVPYVPPPGVPLDPVTDAMAITCHAGPDAAWRTLKPFLGGAIERLTVAMYEFTAPHIEAQLAAVEAAAGEASTLILDPGNDPLTAGDTPESQVVGQLEAALPAKLRFLWAAVRKNGRVTQAIFPSAYHIKVAVRDGAAFWLSSGNWKSSNQPDFDPLAGDVGQGDGPVPPTNPLPAGFLQKHDRDWHVVIQHPGLADTLEKYILHDVQQATPLQAAAGAPAIGAALAAPEMPDVFIPAAAPTPFAVTNPLVFRPREFIFDAAHPLKVQPVLTPDNYAANVLPLITGARTSVYFQNQYIKPRDAADDFAKLVKALSDKIAAGLDVRIILRTGVGPASETRAMLESLQAHGVDPAFIKLQVACHNKGIVVDSSVVLLGSHNWSDQGTTQNRDASLIFFDAGVAKYYERIFLYDWENQAHQFVPEEAAMPVVAQPGEETPPGMVRKSWAEVFGS